MNLPEPIPPDRIFYHWSPTKNRASIERLGLTPGRLTLQGTGWRPPFVAFSDDPVRAWDLSGSMFTEYPAWDLWAVNVEQQTSFEGYETIFDHDSNFERYAAEHRVYVRIYKRDVLYVATREVGP